MRNVCILCDLAYKPEPSQQKKLIKHPHLIQICPSCAERITFQLREKRDHSSSTD